MPNLILEVGAGRILNPSKANIGARQFSCKTRNTLGSTQIARQDIMHARLSLAAFGINYLYIPFRVSIFALHPEESSLSCSIRHLIILPDPGLTSAQNLSTSSSHTSRNSCTCLLTCKIRCLQAVDRSFSCSLRHLAIFPPPG